ncbi:MAG: LysR family transcriptional regulator [Sandaracinaceae bacterium]
MELGLFRGVVPFVAVAEERSFRRAAQRLEVSPAAVSKAVQALEAELGQTLLTRTTRAVRLTREGELFLERCQQAVACVRGGREVLRSRDAEPSGDLTVSVPHLAVSLLAPALAQLSARFARLRFDVRVTDQLSRFAEEPIDVAVRVGMLNDSSLIAKRLRRTRLTTIASPAYLATHGAPDRPAALAAHRCLVVRAPDRKPRPFHFASGPQPVEAVMVVDHAPTLIEAALAGLGITQAFDFMVTEHVAAGRLVAVLEEAATDGPDIHALCAPGRRASPNVRAAFDALAEHFARTAPRGG